MRAHTRATHSCSQTLQWNKFERRTALCTRRTSIDIPIDWDWADKANAFEGCRDSSSSFNNNNNHHCFRLFLNWHFGFERHLKFSSSSSMCCAHYCACAPLAHNGSQRELCFIKISVEITTTNGPMSRRRCAIALVKILFGYFHLWNYAIRQFQRARLRMHGIMAEGETGWRGGEIHLLRNERKEEAFRSIVRYIIFGIRNLLAWKCIEWRGCCLSIRLITLNFSNFISKRSNGSDTDFESYLLHKHTHSIQFTRIALFAHKFTNQYLFRWSERVPTHKVCVQDDTFKKTIILFELTLVGKWVIDGKSWRDGVWFYRWHSLRISHGSCIRR